MSREITISVPDDVAEWCEKDPKALFYLGIDAERRMMTARGVDTTGKSTREALAEIGMVYTDEELEAAGRELDEAAAMMTPQLREFARSLLATPPHLLGGTTSVDA